jgi:hypothetical protein
MQNSQVLSAGKPLARFTEKSADQTSGGSERNTRRAMSAREQSRDGSKRQASSAEQFVCGAELEVLCTDRYLGAIQGEIHRSTGRKVSAYGAIRRPSRSVQCQARSNPQRRNSDRSNLGRIDPSLRQSAEHLERSNPRKAQSVKCRSRSNPGAARKLQGLAAEQSAGQLRTHAAKHGVIRAERRAPSVERSLNR